MTVQVEAEVSGRASLRVFNDPEAVTVVGASADPAKWGYWLGRGAVEGAHRRRVNLVNRHGSPIAGHPSVSSLSEIEGDLGLVVLCVPPLHVPDVVEESLERGASGFLGITAGMDRALGRPGAEVEMARQIRQAGARLVGPNCLGIFDAATDLKLAWGEFTGGQLGIVSQSGQLGSELANLAADRGLGVSRFISVGNQVDVTANEMLEDLIHHDATTVVALYIESFVDGRQLIDTLRRLRAAGKHTLLLTVGESVASKSAAASHTGSLTSALDVVDAACRVAGVLRVQTPAQLIEIAQLLVDAPPIRASRVAIVGDSGGQGAVAADVLTRAGLAVEPFNPALQQALADLLPPDAGLANPVDLAGAGEASMEIYAETVEMLLADPALDAVTLTGYFGSYGLLTPSLQDAEAAVAVRIAKASKRHGKPVVLHSMCQSSTTIDLIRREGVPTYHVIENAGLALGAGAHLTAHSGWDLSDCATDDANGGDELSAPQDGYLAAREFLAGVGIDFPAAQPVRNLSDLTQAMKDLPSPWVLKADWIVHKTEVGGVVVGLEDHDETTSRFIDMKARLGEGLYVLESMDTRPDVVELIIGARRDPVFGPLVLVGAGGIQAELFRDTRIELAPLNEAAANQMLSSLRSRPLLDGWRGKSAVDVAAVTRVIVAMSRLIARSPECEDIEINPVRVGPSGLRAVDALVRRRDSTSFGGES